MAVPVAGISEVRSDYSSGGHDGRVIQGSFPFLGAKSLNNDQYAHQCLLRMTGKVLKQIFMNPALLDQGQLDQLARESGEETDTFFAKMPESDGVGSPFLGRGAAPDAAQIDSRGNFSTKPAHYGQFLYQSLGQAVMRIFYPEDSNQTFIDSVHAKSSFCTVSEEANPVIGTDYSKSFGLFVDGLSSENKRYYLFHLDEKGRGNLMIRATRDQVLAKLNEWSPAVRYLKVHLANPSKIGI